MHIRSYVRIRELTKFDCYMSSGKEVYFRMNPGVQIALKNNNENKKKLFAGREDGIYGWGKG